LAFQPSRSTRVCRIVRMLTTIQLDRHPVLGACEVDDILANGILSAEFVLD
jgi:hypothetical protein